MNLVYLFSHVYDCYCKMDCNNIKAVIADNSKKETLDHKIEKRFEYDELGREHQKTIFHCDICNKNNLKTFETNIKK